MRRSLPIVLLLVACGSDGDDNAPDAPSNQTVQACPPSTDQGVACEGANRCFRYGTCGLSWGAYAFALCECRNGQYDCSLPYTTDGNQCAFPDGVGCSIEGHPTCDEWPSGGGCICQMSIWTCTLICPDGCHGIFPNEGSACTADPTLSCPYHNGHWSCVDGGAHCLSGDCLLPDAATPDGA